MSPQNYLIATQPNNTPFVAPTFPGYLLVVQGTQIQVADQIRAHNENLQKWKAHENVTKALRKQLIDAIEPDTLNTWRIRLVASTSACQRSVAIFVHKLW
jgi:hypothetical protein